MSIKIQNLTDETIANADIIRVIDAAIPDFHHQLLGQESVPPCSAPGSPARRVAMLEIDIDSSDDSQLQDVITKIESAKGCVPQDVQRLRNPK